MAALSELVTIAQETVKLKINNAISEIDGNLANGFENYLRVLMGFKPKVDFKFTSEKSEKKPIKAESQGKIQEIIKKQAESLVVKVALKGKKKVSFAAGAK